VKQREVVTNYNYYEKPSFFRHFAFEINYFFDDQALLLAITPKYLFTSDRKTVLGDRKKITQYTNFLTSKEFNQQVLNHIYFIVQYLSDKGEFIIADYDNCKISLSSLIKINVSFGIPTVTGHNNQKMKKVAVSDHYVQPTLF
jgi:hypothetical protein